MVNPIEFYKGVKAVTLGGYISVGYFGRVDQHSFQL